MRGDFDTCFSQTEAKKKNSAAARLARIAFRLVKHCGETVKNLVGQAAPFPLTLYSPHSSSPCWELFLKTVSDKTPNLGGCTRLSQTAAIRHS